MITYFVQVNVCWLLFYGAYFALLSRETFFRLNRIWLIISLLGGLVLPLIAPSFEVIEPTNMAAVMLQPFVVTGENINQNLQNTEGSVFKVLAAIYGLGVLISLGKLLFGFWKIKRLHQLAERLPMDDFTLMQVREAIAPFSFFRWVFINLNLVEHADLQQIIMHERAHVRERHSIDVVFAEILGVVFWWSPLVYFYTKSLKNVHEYAADAAVLRTSSPPQYGRLLLRQQQSGMSLSLTNPFFSQLKKRILMMTRNPSKRRALAKYALAVPIFLVLTLLLASPKTKVMATTEAATENMVASITTFEKTLTAPQNVANEMITLNPLPHSADGVPIFEPQQQVELAKISELPIASFGGRSRRGMIAAKDLLSSDKLEAYQVINGKAIPVEILSFVVARLPFTHKEDYAESNNVGAQLNSESKRLLELATTNDMFQFMEVKCRVKGENMPVNAGSLAFIVKGTPPQYSAPKDSTPVFTIVEEFPVFVGGLDSMFRFLAQNIHYPAEARQLRVQGTVWIGFIVEKDGSLTNLQVKRNLPEVAIDTIKIFGVDGAVTGSKIVKRQDQSCANEAMRVVNLMPKWKGGKTKGKPVRVSYILPIKFKLE